MSDLPVAAMPPTYDEYRAKARFPALDGLRAISVLLVITVHMKDDIWRWLSGGTGVTVFFVLSGYLITMLALREEEERGKLNLGAFYIRRCFRILPLYYLVLAIYCLVVLPFPGKHAVYTQFREALPYYLFYFNEFAPSARFYQSWSLGVEEKFYLFWPLLTFVLFRSAPVARFVVTGLLIAVFRIAAANDPRWAWLGWYSEILIGCLLALCLHNRAVFEKLQFMGNCKWALAAAFVFAAGQLSFVWFACAREIYPWLALVLLTSVLLGGHSWQRFLQSKPMVFIGERSYAIYLVHLLCRDAVQKVIKPGSGRIWVAVAATLLTAALAVVVADLFRRFVEKPMLAAGRKLSDKILTKRSGLSVAAK